MGNIIETFYYHYEIGHSRKWSVNIPFLCTRCGNCCALSDVLSASRELTGEPTEQQVNELNEKLQPYIDEYYKIPNEKKGHFWDKTERDRYLETTKCPFLLEDNLCSIYEYRPIGCRLFPKTSFGMDSEICEALQRFKVYREVLEDKNKFLGWVHFTFKEDSIEPVKMSKWRYDHCIKKLLKVGMTQDELKLFEKLNERSK